MAKQSLNLQTYQNIETGNKYTLLGFANYITDSGVQNVVVFHPELDIHSLYVMDIQSFRFLYRKWKEG